MKTLAHLVASMAIAGALCFLTPLLTMPFTNYGWTASGVLVLGVLVAVALLLRVVLREWLQPTSVLRGGAVLTDAVLAYVVCLALWGVLSWLLIEL